MQIAQLNVARMVAPLDSEAMAGFVAALGPVNAAADAAPGFVWRLVEDGAADATAFRIDDDALLLVNLSVWRSPEDLVEFAFRHLDHARALRRRRDWFERASAPTTVLWWVPDGHRPDPAEALGRLTRLRREGSGSDAFGLRLPVPEPPFTGPPTAP